MLLLYQIEEIEVHFLVWTMGNYKGFHEVKLSSIPLTHTQHTHMHTHTH